MPHSSLHTDQPAAAKRRTLPGWLTSFGTHIVVALILGLILGGIALSLGESAGGERNWLHHTLQLIGQNYVKILRAAVVPLIFTAIVSSIVGLRKVTNAAKLAGSTLVWFGVTALISVTIGIVLGETLQPGALSSADDLTPTAPSRVGGWLDFLIGIIPANFLGLTVSGQVDLDSGAVNATPGFNILQVIVVSMVVGLAALKIGERAEPFIRVTEAALAIIHTLLWWIIRLAPIGTLGLIGNAVAEYGWTKMQSLTWFVAVLYIGLAAVLFIVYPLIVKFNGLSVRQFFSGVWPAVQLGFVSRSSIGTLPLTQRVTERNLGVPRGYASFAVPFGATTKMDGCAAIYPAISALFVAQFFGIDLNVTQYLLIALVAVVGSAATAGTTGATVMLTLTLSTLGLPLEGVGLLLAVDPILDMGRTAVNVAGQALVPTIVAKRAGILNKGLYDAPRRGLAFDHDTDDAAPLPQHSHTEEARAHV